LGDAAGVESRLRRAQDAIDRYLQDGEIVMVLACDPGNLAAGMVLEMEYYGSPGRGAVPEWSNEVAEMSWLPWLTFDGMAVAIHACPPTAQPFRIRFFDLFADPTAGHDRRPWGRSRLAPVLMPAKTPSSRTRRRAISRARSSDTASISSMRSVRVMGGDEAEGDVLDPMRADRATTVPGTPWAPPRCTEYWGFDSATLRRRRKQRHRRPEATPTGSAGCRRPW
jgi:hypothetical protein